jgi:hypothetical protein
MLPPPSVLRPYGVIDASDDALVQPELAPEPARLPDEPEEDFLKRAKDWAEAGTKTTQKWWATYNRAAETGNWEGLLIPGRTPTIFHVRPVGIAAWSAFKRVGLRLVQDELAILAFRIAVIEIENLPLAIKFARGPFTGDDGRREPKFGDVLDESVVDAIGAAEGGRDIVIRVGLAILRQRGAPLGK